MTVSNYLYNVCLIKPSTLYCHSYLPPSPLHLHLPTRMGLSPVAVFVTMALKAFISFYGDLLHLVGKILNATHCVCNYNWQKMETSVTFTPFKLNRKNTEASSYSNFRDFTRYSKIVVSSWLHKINLLVFSCYTPQMIF